ncbi:MAG TPA: ATP-binding protein [Stellaceae bacterium]|nr:ATP-binding protein [Stellaceae bacterium]
MPPQRRIRDHLMIVVGACVLPIVLAAVVAVCLLSFTERRNGEVQIMATGHATAGVVEQQLGTGIADLRALATLLPAASGDLRRFFDECQAVSEQDGGWILFAHATGEVIFDTRQQLGSAPPQYEDKASIAQVVATKDAVVSNLFLGAADQQPQFSVHLPIVDRERVRYILTLSYPATALAARLAAQPLPPGWTVTVIDRDRVTLASTAHAETATGQRLPAEAPGLASDQKQGLFATDDSAGTPIYLAAIRSAASGWEVDLGVPQAVVDAPIGRALQIVLGSGALVVLIGIGFALFVGSDLAQVLSTLSASAVGLVDMKPVPPLLTRVSEINDVIAATRLAGERLNVNERSLRGVEEHLARAQVLASMGSFEHDFHSGRTEWTDTCYAIFGQSPQTFTPTAQNFLACVHPDDRAAARRLLARLRQHRPRLATDLRIVRPSGEARTINLQIEMLREGEEEPVGYIGICHDVTDRAQAAAHQRALDAAEYHSGKAEAVGQLVGAIAQDIAAALTPILSLTKSVRGALPPESPERDRLEIIMDAAQRIRDLVKRILALGRPDSSGQTVIDLSEVVRDALRILRSAIPANISIDCEVGSTAPIMGDPAQLHQVIACLVGNAAEAIGEQDGTVSVHVEMRKPRKRGQRRLVLSVADTGRGMDEATRQRIFEPFAGGGEGKGSGLGLALVHGIIAGHKGAIDVTSTPGRGTRFEIAFPIVPQEAVAPAQ